VFAYILRKVYGSKCKLDFVCRIGEIVQLSRFDSIENADLEPLEIALTRDEYDALSDEQLRHLLRIEHGYGGGHHDTGDDECLL
jgi:hypothetical protein